jgi:3-hydroxyisobutyrate dehydrogenase
MGATRRVCLIGAGRMGGPMAGQLAAHGHGVTIADSRVIDPPAGAAATTDIVAAARAAEVVISVLPTSRVLLEVAERVMPTMTRRSAWIDMGSNDPETSAALLAIAGPVEMRVLDAPVGGGPESAARGDLALYIGGERETFEEFRDLLEAVAHPDRLHFLGRHGSGYVAKLLINLIWFGQAVAMGEALLVAKQMGIELGAMHEALRGSAVAGAFVEKDVSALLAGDYLTTFGLQGCYDELVAIEKVAEQTGTPFTLSRAVTDIYRQALARFGPVDGELLAVALLESQAGVQLRSGSPGVS